jgi:ribosomal protein S18 acetylase RimI-like enzyme
LPLNIVIRSATENDESTVTDLWTLCGLVTSYNDPSQDFRFALGKPSSDILVALMPDHKIVGSVMVGHDGHRGWIYYVAADPAQRLQGIGSRLVEAAEDWLRARNVPKIMLMVRETNMHIIDFYKHLNFEELSVKVLQKWLK